MPIGFFSPLPLAMMIPFMATQSLAMGEAFGKSFQFGKRKISSMSNEDFNKLTFQNLMQDQTANIASLIPELTKQMQSSSNMQQQIFQEMIKLVPTFINAITSSLSGTTTSDQANGEWWQSAYGQQQSNYQPPPDYTPETPQQKAAADAIARAYTLPPQQGQYPTRVTTPDLSVYNNMNLSQLQNLNATGTLKSHIDTLIRNRQQETKSTPSAVAYTKFTGDAIDDIKQILKTKASIASAEIKLPLGWTSQTLDALKRQYTGQKRAFRIWVRNYNVQGQPANIRQKANQYFTMKL